MNKDIKELEKNRIIPYGWLAFLFIICHFYLIIFSILPKSYSPESIHKISNSYVNPIFTQRWGMFAPCPIIENKFELKYYFDNDTLDWINPSLPTLEKHKKYRASYHGNIAVGQYNILFWLKLDLDTLSIEKNSIINFQEYPNLKSKRGFYWLHNYAKGYSSINFKTKPNRIDIRISYRNIVDSTQNSKYTFLDYR